MIRTRYPVACRPFTLQQSVGAKGEREGVKLEQQALVTEDGYDMLSTYPLEEALLD